MKLLCCIIEFSVVWITMTNPHSFFVFPHDTLSFDGVFYIQYFSIFSTIFSIFNATSSTLSLTRTFSEIVGYHCPFKEITKNNQFSESKIFFNLIYQMFLHLSRCDESYVQINQSLCFPSLLDVNFNN